MRGWANRDENANRCAEAGSYERVGGGPRPRGTASPRRRRGHAMVLIPEEAERALREIATHHADRDEAPILYCYVYAIGKGDEDLQPKYDEANARMMKWLSDRSDDEVEAAWATHGRFLGLSYRAPSTAEQLARLPRREQLAHALASAAIDAAFYGFAAHLSGEAERLSRVLAALPQLVAQLTPKEGLLPLGPRTVLKGTWIDHAGHELQFHPALRQAFGSNIDKGLVEALTIAHERGCAVAVAFDHLRLAVRGTLRKLEQRDAWFGAPFDEASLDDLMAVGATVHERTRRMSPFADGATGWRTEVRWHSDGALKTFEIEELPPPEEGREWTLCRYVHALRDPGRRAFVHLDGAMHGYGADSYAKRYAQSLNHREPKVWCERKMKLFRLDATATATISAQAWASLVVDFFKGNEMPLEYLAGESFREMYQRTYGVPYPDFDRS